MKLQRNVAGVLLACASVLLFSISQGGLAAETNTNAPTGLYVSITDIPATFIVRLGTNGDYRVHAKCRTPVGGLSQQGHWKWDNRRQEFLLTPMTNSAAFPYEFRRLRVTYQSDTLQWIPLHSGGAVGSGVGAVGSGVIDYVRFKRKTE